MAILTNSMEVMIDQIRELQAVNQKREVGAGTLESLMPNAGRVFNSETSLKTLKTMLHCHKGPAVYRLNDYHYLLLYDTLEYFCDTRNEMLRTAPNAREKNKASRIAGVHTENLPSECKFADDIYDGVLQSKEKVRFSICDTGNGAGDISVRAINNTSIWTRKFWVRDGDIVDHQ